MKNKKLSLLFIIPFVVTILGGCSSKCKHSNVITNPQVNPTCISHGLTESTYCEKCGEVLKEAEIIEPLGHDVVIDEAITVSCL